MPKPERARQIERVRTLLRGGSITGLQKQEALDLKKAAEDEAKSRSTSLPILTVRPQFVGSEEEDEAWKVVHESAF